MEKVHPVVLAVPTLVKEMSGKDKTRALSGHARIALAQSAEFYGVTLGALDKGERGRPLPSNGIYWSLSHTKEFVAAVAAPHPIGIDIEKISPVVPAVQARLAAPDEWDLVDEVGPELFCRYWTAKEAVLKAEGCGLAGLAKCRITEVVDAAHLSLLYESQIWIVSLFTGIADYLVSVSVPADGTKWHTPDVHAKCLC
ncbi:MAG: 4'-phosphopantetheinyl transferase superfamily protein [Spirochaetales bacterium]|jgi:4'-phosphopantetheinyl transferase|nr:4'-phosphopantetheinyl transferase superfamily protein [Spirochaetales bacterium]